MNNPITETASWKTQYYLTLTTSPSVGATLMGQDWYDSGASASISTDNIVAIDSGSRYRFNGWTTDNMSEIADASSTSTTVKMDSAKTVTAYYMMQYYLTVTSPHGTTGGEGWYDSGDTAYATVTPLTVPGTTGVRYVFTNWSGDATGTTSPSDNITMDGPKTATAVWKTQYYLTLTTSPSVGVTLIGAGWYDSGASASISTDNIVPIDSGSRYRFNGWTTDNMSEIADASSASTTVTMDSAKIVTADYTMQYLVTFGQIGLSNDAVGTALIVGATNYTYSSLPVTIWVDNGTTYSYTSMVPAGAGKQYVLTGVLGPASPITSSGTVTGTYKTVEQFTLSLVAGWNLVSFPVDNSPTTPSGIFTGLTYYTDYYIYAWTAPNGPYALIGPTDVLQDNLGYWVYITSDQTITWSSTQPVSRDVYMVTGWNMVGFPVVSGTTTPDNIFAPLAYYTDYYLYTWTAPSGPYALVGPTDQLLDNTGYLVYTTTDKIVTVP